MKIINLTSHEVAIHCGSKVADHRVAPSGKVARIEVAREPGQYHIGLDDCVDGLVTAMPTYRARHGKVVGLPKPKAGVLLLVSLAVRLAVPDRHDVVSPGTLLRDRAGNPVACDGVDGNW